MAIKFKGDDLESGLVEWVKSNIKESHKISYDLGKFFFTVSISTIGVVATLEKLDNNSEFDSPMIVSLISLFTAMLISIDLARPKELKITGESDLQIVYHDKIRKVTWRILFWFSAWLAGSVLGGYAAVFT
ncbi:hypothetical protein [Pseudomaricurvus sp. HS19]|uniref:hypothetical protein n=1 Tax=Pseudomaricurvus sp. HS19 TaxID=2692626 RepID=UPI0013721ECC|nr:hypothetical protein [Pseudomaricurvus sp. HS19]MYM62419.1 hypothetical protein [Pseudomaricurvus sp. HS19]